MTTILNICPSCGPIKTYSSQDKLKYYADIINSKLSSASSNNYLGETIFFWIELMSNEFSIQEIKNSLDFLISINKDSPWIIKSLEYFRNTLDKS